jgi:hypothetical protein
MSLNFEFSVVSCVGRDLATDKPSNQGSVFSINYAQSNEYEISAEKIGIFYYN